MNFLALFTFNVFLNSILMFFTVVVLIEGIIFLFRMRLGRITAFLRMIPILKLPVDLFFYNFSRWSHVHGIDLLGCAEGSRTLSAAIGFNGNLSNFFSPVYSMIQFTTAKGMTFTLADIISHFISPFFLIFFMVFLLGISFLCLLRKGWGYHRFMYSLRYLEHREDENKVNNVEIKKRLEQFRLRMINSPSLKGSPFIAGLRSKAIYLPVDFLKTLTKKEYEAVLAHEIEHIQNKDLYIRLILDLIGAVFWWIPTKWLRKQIEEAQEIACDLQCKKYAVQPLDLASALHKSATFSLDCPKPVIGESFTKCKVQRRIKMLLCLQSTRFRKLRLMFSALLLMLAFFIVLLGRFWIF